MIDSSSVSGFVGAPLWSSENALAHSLMEMFHAECETQGVLHTPEDCFKYTSELPERYEQMRFF